jgi:hypothetical protein
MALENLPELQIIEPRPKALFAWGVFPSAKDSLVLFVTRHYGHPSNNWIEKLLKTQAVPQSLQMW